MSTWEVVYEDEFAHVYDADIVERIDLKWDGKRLTIVADDTCELDIDGVVKLRKLLQAIERRKPTR